MSTREQFNLERLVENPAASDSLLDYVPGDSLVHRLHPVTKLVVSLGVTLVAFAWPSFEVPLVLLACVAVVPLYAGVVRNVFRVVLTVGTPLIVSLFVVQGLFYPGNQTPFVRLAGVPFVDSLVVWEEGLRFSLLISSRLFVFMISLLVVVTTTHPKKLTIALTDWGMPNKLSYVFLSAIQFVPQMRKRARAILDAQRARGLDTNANLRSRFRSFLALMSPLLISMLITAQTRALALESRGFTRIGDRTALYDVPDSTLDRGLRVATYAGCLAVLLWRVVAWL
jgi:energy-coupling factor transport system permease protein